MTITPATEQHQHQKRTKNPSRRSKKGADGRVTVTINEKDPLLPKKGGHGEFNGASVTGGVMNLSTTIIGAGIMALPATMKVLGLGLGIVFIVLVGLLTYSCIGILMKFSRIANCDSYASVMEDAFGKAGRVSLQLCVVINIIGTLIVYMIILGDVLCGTSANNVVHVGVLEGWFGEQWWTGRTIVLLVTTLVVFAPLASFKRMDSLSFTSALAVGLALVFLVITAGITIVKMTNGSLPMPRLLPDVTDINSVWTLFTVVPVLVTAYICHFNVHTISNELEDPSLMELVVKISLLLCSTVYIMTSFFGFLLFGDSTLDDVLANFDSNLGIPYGSQLNDVVRISYALHLMLVFPIVFYALRVNADGLLFPSAWPPLTLDNKRFAITSISLLSITFLGANYIPSIWDVFQFTGATAAVCIGFIFPAAIALRDVHGIATMNEKVLSVFMIGLAVFSSSVAIYSDTYDYLTRKWPLLPLVLDTYTLFVVICEKRSKLCNRTIFLGAGCRRI